MNPSRPRRKPANGEVAASSACGAGSCACSAAGEAHNARAIVKAAMAPSVRICLFRGRLRQVAELHLYSQCLARDDLPVREYGPEARAADVAQYGFILEAYWIRFDQRHIGAVAVRVDIERDRDVAAQRVGIVAQPSWADRLVKHVVGAREPLAPKLVGVRRRAEQQPCALILRARVAGLAECDGPIAAVAQGHGGRDGIALRLLFE